MLKRHERYLKVFAPTTEEGDGEFLGYYPISMTYRTAEEIEAGDVLYTNLRFSAYAERRRAPVGGYRRGMILESEDGSERYHILVPVTSGRMWIMKTERVMQNGDGEETGYGRIQ